MRPWQEKVLSFFRREFSGSQSYWERRYASGDDSGVGSYGAFAEFKAEVLSKFVSEHGVRSVIEFGCGDGNQLSLSNYPEYLGVDVSPMAVSRCREFFSEDATKNFIVLGDYRGERAELALSLDVIFHLVEDEVYEEYMRTLFFAAKRFVIVYASNADKTPKGEASHVRHRRFTDWVDASASDWQLMLHVPNRYPYEGDYKKGSFSDFYIFEKGADEQGGRLADTAAGALG